MVIEGSTSLIIGAALILLSSAFALRNKQSLNRLETVGLVAGLVSLVLGAITFVFGNDFVIPFFWRVIIIVISIIVILLSLFIHRILRHFPHTSEQSRAQSEIQQYRPRLEFGGPVVRHQSYDQHGGTYDNLTYFLEVMNNTSNTVSENCRGSITVSRTNITNQSTVWEKNYQESIEIGDREFLYLFKVLIFRGQGGREETRLYFSHPLDTDLINEVAIRTYREYLDKKLTVSVQSTNAGFPSRKEPYSKTIRQIIQEAVEE